MPANYADLFTPLPIRHVTLRNRIVAPPMVQLRSIIAGEGLAWYRRLAAGGAALVTVEATGVPAFGAELTVKSLKPLANAIKSEGAAAAIQLFPIPFGQTRDLMALTTSDLRTIVSQYATAAAICRDAGFDGVEVHGAHNYLLNQFIMPTVNQRTDAYGGSIDHRCRLAVEIVTAIRAAVGQSLLILYRHTPVGEGYWINDSLVLAHHLIDAGVDVLDISPARDKTVGDLAAPFKTRFGNVPVIAVKGMEDPAAACRAIRDQRCDLVAVGRQLIADAKWPLKVQAGGLDEIIECRQCNQGCFGRLKAHQQVQCVLWDRDEVGAYAR